MLPASGQSRRFAPFIREQFGPKVKETHSSVLTVSAVGLAAFGEIGVALCASAGLFTAHGLFWTVVLAPFLFRHPTRTRRGFFAGMIVCLAILYVVPWNSRMPFLHAGI